MKADQHLISGAGAAMLTVKASEVLTTKCNIMQSIIPVVISDNQLVNIITIVFYVFGLLLPDIDFKLHIKHRTYTHTIWFVLLFAALGLKFVPFFGLAYGYFIHILFDSLSRCGICWLYPLSRYKTFPNGGKVKSGHFIYLYRNDNFSAYIVSTAALVISLLITLL